MRGENGFTNKMNQAFVLRIVSVLKCFLIKLIWCLNKQILERKMDLKDRKFPFSTKVAPVFAFLPDLFLCVVFGDVGGLVKNRPQ